MTELKTKELGTDMDGDDVSTPDIPALSSLEGETDKNANSDANLTVESDSSSISTEDEDLLKDLENRGDEFDESKNSKEDKPKDASEALLLALQHKETGNKHFSATELIEASRCYRKGISLLKPFNQANSGDEQIQSLLVTMHTNMSMVCYKQSKLKLAKDAAGKALEIDASNVKALYRRALAQRSLGDEEAALDDLKAAYKLDEQNTAVKKEISNIRKSRELAKQNEKMRMQKAFSSGSLLYGDREDEAKRAAKRKEEERKEREERDAKEKEKRTKEWEDDCVEKLKNGEEVLSFEQWDEERVKREQEARKEAEKKRREERKAAKTTEKEDTDSEDELTEKELAMLRGYKKTSDGRTTSYFTREQTEKEKELIGCIKPKRLESNVSEIGASTEQLQSTIGSVWNQAGTTWEEKDTTDWCKSCLKECLLDSMAVHTSECESGTYVAQVKGVDALTGDASVALAGGKKRYIYDFHTDIKYEISNENGCIASGSLKLPDINSAHTAEEELEVEILKWKKSPNEDCEINGAEACRTLLVIEIRKSVLKFVEKFNHSF